MRGKELYTVRLFYWITTILLCLFLLWSAYSYLFSKQTIEGIRELGFPDFFRMELAILKIIAVIMLLIPQLSAKYKMIAYTGVSLFLLTALVAHAAHGDHVFMVLANVFLLILLASSYVSLMQLSRS